MKPEIESKWDALLSMLQSMQSVVIAFSGGVDSTLLLAAAREALGDKAVAVTAVSASLAPDEKTETRELARTIGIQHEFIESHELKDARYLSNSPQRCYFCKQDVYGRLVEFAETHGYSYIIDGTNADDIGDHRPGRRAAQEKQIRSPLLECGINKQEIRTLAKHMGLPNWDKPAAACLSSRIPYGTHISPDMLAQVAEGERYLKSLGIGQVRLRHHAPIARIEVDPQDFEILLAHREEVVTQLREFGYTHITIDLAGFQSGSLNLALSNNGHRETTSDPA